MFKVGDRVKILYAPRYGERTEITKVDTINKDNYYYVVGHGCGFFNNQLLLIETKKEFTLEKTIVVYCPAERQAKKLMQEIERFGWLWKFAGDKPTERNEWNIYKEQTVYYLNDDKTLQFTDYEYATKHPEEGALHSFEGAMKVLGVPPMTATEYQQFTSDIPVYGHAICGMCDTFPQVRMDACGYVGELAGIQAFVRPDLLNSNKPKKMSMLDQNLRDRFFKKEETKIYELIEDCQEKFEPLNEILDYLIALKAEYNEIAEDINDDIECNDKKELKKDKKRLEERYKKVFADKLTEQFIVVGKKIIK